MLLALMQRHHQRFAAQRFAIHLCYCPRGLFRRAVAHKPEALGSLLVGWVAHDTRTGDGTVRSERFTELIVSNSIGDVLHIDIHTLIFGYTLLIKGIQARFDLSCSLILLLSAAHIQFERSTLTVLQGFICQFFKSLRCSFVLSKIYETEPFAFTFRVKANGCTRNSSERFENFLQLLVIPGHRKLFHVQVSPVSLTSTLLVTHKKSHMHFHIINESSIEFLDSILGSFRCLEVHVTVSLGSSGLVLGDFARKNVTKDRKRVVQTFVVHRRSKISHKHIANT
mmetsp:Transcript_2530/g.3949  ORF Transcript_2530/g.3949 Transcript_2530/m.3949 type:complete len:282 (-) Transcript_2530:467-1312(-)